MDLLAVYLSAQWWHTVHTGLKDQPGSLYSVLKGQTPGLPPGSHGPPEAPMVPQGPPIWACTTPPGVPEGLPSLTWAPRAPHGPPPPLGVPSWPEGLWSLSVVLVAMVRLYSPLLLPMPHEVFSPIPHDVCGVQCILLKRLSKIQTFGYLHSQTSRGLSQHERLCQDRPCHSLRELGVHTPRLWMRRRCSEEMRKANLQRTDRVFE